MSSTAVHPSFKTDPYWKVMERESQKALVAEMIDKGIRQG
jgi:hypothetical protein